MYDGEQGPSALASLLSAYAGQDAGRHRLLWALDARLAHLVTATTEPMIGQIRIAWWNEALNDRSGIQGKGEPLVDEMRAANMLPPPGLAQWLDGWEALIGDIDLEAYALGRGRGLFHALSGEAEIPDWLARAGAAWALWDFSGHAREDRAVALGRQYLLTGTERWPAKWRPMRIAYGLARGDILKGRHAPSELTPRLYLRLMRVALMGR